jgi:hypothetical protein
MQSKQQVAVPQPCQLLTDPLYRYFYVVFMKRFCLFQPLIYGAIAWAFFILNYVHLIASYSFFCFLFLLQSSAGSLTDWYTPRQIKTPDAMFGESAIQHSFFAFPPVDDDVPTASTPACTRRYTRQGSSMTPCMMEMAVGENNNVSPFYSADMMKVSESELMNESSSMSPIRMGAAMAAQRKRRQTSSTVCLYENVF